MLGKPEVELLGSEEVGNLGWAVHHVSLREEEGWVKRFISMKLF